ncbi:phosphatidylinositol N-acetylglucosaminyltransferase subunit C-like isoform X2 [Pomacea canaliculata]|uniref:phosphatidylinositol N-acetylglucosaminyltransferase subunit C-like isoform X2 n=1 Tax=Pomacea canaliculata TaxID=400727 RepID=UPI000D73BF80|nr:phosphatidylinositol N-acetylglucosaminyltransferase subunit C-like isoform X2 [Pomacea canaliculata]
MEEYTKWRKILYEDQGVADNYVPPSFLKELKKNLHTHHYDYWTLVVQSGILTQQISSFIYMEEKMLSPQTLMMGTSFATAILYMVNDILTEVEPDVKPQRSYFDDLKTALMFAGINFVLSPLLVSLTETVSTDTIYTMTTIMLLANLAFHDYTAAPHTVPGALSLNAAIFASVCLASRLHTTWHAFATVTFSFKLFALWPVLRRRLQKHLSVAGQVAMTSVISAVTFCLMLSVSNVGTVLYSLIFIFITFVCPVWLIMLQPYKNNIYGPWDEAEIKEGQQEM